MSGMNRRNFMKAVGVAGAMVGGMGAIARAEDKPAEPAKKPAGKVATRPFGKTGVNVPMLSLGGIFDITTNQIMLHRAYESGVTYWDTADCYIGGKSEEGIGMWFGKYPERRKEIFLVSKSDARDTEGMTRLLNRSFERMKTTWVDLYFIHGVGNISELNDGTKAWAEKMKKEGKIKLFGFSTHKNMEEVMLAGSKLGYIDAIMPKIDYRLAATDRMKSAVEACVKAGIGLTAMKTQGGGPVKSDNDAEIKLAGRFVQKGWTEHQAKLKAIWEIPGIAAICSAMYNTTVLASNVAAALDDVKLTSADHAALREHAVATCTGYCAGCGAICEGATGLPVADVMRHLMYHRTYGQSDFARESFRALGGETIAALARGDFAQAERLCPQQLPIAQLMREAAQLLG